MNSRENSESLVLTPNEVRKLLKCSRGVVYEGIRRGIIPSIRISPRKILIPRAALERKLAEAGSDGSLT